MPEVPGIASVIVAAGMGSRMGGVAKALLQLDGRSFLQSISDCLQAAGVEEIVVVVGEPHGQETHAEARRLNLQIVENAAPELGMASSVAIGFGFARNNFAADRCFLWPVDLPRVKVQTLQVLAEHGTSRSIALPVYNERGAHPVLVGRDFWPELAACTHAEQGARTVFRKHSDAVRRINVDDRGVAMDVDSPKDLQGLQS